MRPAFSLSWNVEWLGSFPVPGTDPDSVSQRLDRFVPQKPAIAVQLSVSVSGVKVCVPNNERPLFCHSIRRINCVVGRTERNQVAYIAREPSGQVYRRLCHLFKTKSSYQVEEIESVLGNAFQAAAALSRQPSSDTPLKLTPAQFSTPILKTAATASSAASSNSAPTAAGIESCNNKLQTASAVLLHRIFGKSKTDATADSNNKENNTTAMVAPSSASKRRRRPVSAVFSQALHRLSSASISNRRYPSADTPRKTERPISICQPSSSTPVTTKPNYNHISNNIQRLSTPQVQQMQENILRPIRHTQTAPSLRYDERLTEWIYPVDEALEKQLQQVAYFCKTAHRNRLVGALLEQPEGAFVVRFSESKRKCLALSVRVPFTHNPTGVSHYLIIRNENGFKLRGSNKYFPSIPMLVTHHSVMPEQLPCRLIFAHWGNTWKTNELNNNDNNNYDYPPCEQLECSNNRR